MIKTLIIDDDKLICLLHKKFIIKSKIDQNPISFLEADLALDYLKKHLPLEPRYLILLDINMDKMDAWKFLGCLKIIDQNKKCNVVLVTSSISLEDKEQAKKTGMVMDFIEKPLLMKHCEDLKKIQSLETLFN